MVTIDDMASAAGVPTAAVPWIRWVWCSVWGVRTPRASTRYSPVS